MIRAIFTTVTLLFLNMAMALAEDVPDSIDAFTAQGETVEFIKTHDPGFIVLRLPDDSVIDTTYQEGFDYKILWQWEAEAKKDGRAKSVLLCYTIERGVYVRDPESGVEFLLTGKVVPHPIDMAEMKARGLYSSNPDLIKLKELAMAGWEAQLDLVYERLGGNDNPALRKAKASWERYRKVQAEYLRGEYYGRQGSIWRLVYMDRVIALVRNQAHLWQTVVEW